MSASIFAGAQSSGVEGTIKTSPIHGGPSRMGVEDSAPVANAAFDVVNGTDVVASFKTDDSGHFRVPLPPGRYSIKMPGPRRIGGCASFAVEVSAGEFKKVHIECDSGIR